MIFSVIMFRLTRYWRVFIVSVMGIVMNTILLGFSTTAVAVYGACIRIQSIVTIGAHGINNGLIHIVAFNYGAKHMDKIDTV